MNVFMRSSKNEHVTITLLTLLSGQVAKISVNVMVCMANKHVSYLNLFKDFLCYQLRKNLVINEGIIYLFKLKNKTHARLLSLAQLFS